MNEFTVSFDEAARMFPEGDAIHTFRETPIALVGADWERSELLKAMRQYGVERSGPMATKMGHGLVLQDEYGPVFIATR